MPSPEETTLGAIALVVLPLIGSFLGSLLLHWLDKNREKHRIFLEELHRRRVDKIAQLYALLARMEAAAADLLKPLRLHGESSEDEKQTLLNQAWQNLLRFYRENKLFFSNEQIALVDKMIDLIQEAMWDYAESRPSGRDGLPDFNLAKKAWTTIRESVPPVRNALETQFRIALDPE